MTSMLEETSNWCQNYLTEFGRAVPLGPMVCSILCSNSLKAYSGCYFHPVPRVFRMLEKMLSVVSDYLFVAILLTFSSYVIVLVLVVFLRDRACKTIVGPTAVRRPPIVTWQHT